MNALHLGVSNGHEKVVKELASRTDQSVINAVDKVRSGTPSIPDTLGKSLKCPD